MQRVLSRQNLKKISIGKQIYNSSYKTLIAKRKWADYLYQAIALLNIALKNHGNIAELQWLLSAAKVLSRTMSRYTPAMFTLLLFILILCTATIWL